MQNGNINKTKQYIQSALGRYNYRYNRIFRKACATSTYPRLSPRLSRFRHPFKHTVGENFPGGIWEVRRKRELSCRGNTALRGVPRVTPAAASQHPPEDTRRKAKEVFRARNISSECFKKDFATHHVCAHKIKYYFWKIKKRTALFMENFIEKDCDRKRKGLLF